VFDVVEHFSLVHTLKVILGLYLRVVREVLAVYPEPVHNLGQLLLRRVLEILDVFEIPVEACKTVKNSADFLKRAQFNNLADQLIGVCELFFLFI